MRLSLLALTGCVQVAHIGESAPPIVVDLDGDGFEPIDDCDDDEPLAFPGAIERCDGIDNDCDGLTDATRPVEGSTTPAYRACAQHTTFQQDMRLDLLFVVDDSPSMLDSQLRIAEGVGDLLDWVVGPRLDTHIGAITSDVDGPFGRGHLIEVEGAQWADGDLSIPVEDWAAQALVPGLGGRSDERPLDAILMALAPQINPGFRRPDAHLAVVLLTDEDDSSTVSPIEFLDAMDEVGGPRGASVHGLISDGEACPDPLLSATLMGIVDATGGLRESICSPDYGAFLSPVGQLSAQRALNDRFVLPSPAQLGSVRVTITYEGGLVTDLDPDREFTLSPSGNAVILSDPPPAGSRVIVHWLAQPGSL